MLLALESGRTVARRIPFDDPQTLTYVRIAYVATQVTVLGVYYYVAQQVRCITLCSCSRGAHAS